MSPVIAAPIDRLLYKPEEAAEALAVGRSTVYELMAEGALTYIKLGRIRRIRRADLETYVKNLAPCPADLSTPRGAPSIPLGAPPAWRNT
ncbi:helix-turn-helix domain-containing protein [Streptomyces sp. NPDC005773]|uniref:helix-turn-helix domain-containing protein n=1 Tax=Streptomyces sp. NPDC005773 TaxID=3364727 RepID=UPI003683A0E5